MIKSPNRERLEQFWKRTSFHDELIEAVTALRGRVIIRLIRMTLIITGVTVLKRCELPTVWLDVSIIPDGAKFTMTVQTETGDLIITGHDVRLLRNDDLAVLIPPIDA